jgi:SAM-dependent methyltransferase
MSTPVSSAVAARHFEKLHRDEAEPWMFADRAAEILRHEWIVKAALEAAPRTTLDVGCTAGQLTERLASVLTGLTAIDVSPTAAAVARERTRFLAHRPGILAGSVLSLPLDGCSVDLIVAADGLYSWDLCREDRARALGELYRVSKPGSRIVFTEFMRPSRFDEFIQEIKRSPFKVRAIEYLYDRPWYQFESWFRAVQHLRAVRWVRRNVPIARLLSAVGRIFGPVASRHICVVAERPVEDGCMEFVRGG